MEGVDGSVQIQNMLKMIKKLLAYGLWRPLYVTIVVAVPHVYKMFV